MLKKEGKNWNLYSKTTGKLLGKHPSRAHALKQEMAINLSKLRKILHKIPKK